MKKVWKAVLGFTLGAGAAAGAAYAVYRAKCEMDAMPDETGSGVDKTKQWLKMKKDHFKEQIDEKNEQIAEIIENLKAKLIDEQIPEVRKELMEKASEQIQGIKSEIKELMQKRSRELSAIAHRISDSELLQELTDLISSVDKSTKKKLKINQHQKNGVEKCCDESDTDGWEPVEHFRGADACCCDAEEFRSEAFDDIEKHVEEVNEIPIVFEGDE